MRIYISLFLITVVAFSCKKKGNYPPGKHDNIKSVFYIKGDFDGKHVHQELERYYPFHSYYNSENSLHRSYIYSVKPIIPIAGQNFYLSPNPKSLIWETFRYEFLQDYSFDDALKKVGNKYVLDTFLSRKDVIAEFWLEYPQGLIFKHMSHPKDSIQYREIKDTIMAGRQFEIHTLHFDSLHFANPVDPFLKFTVKDLTIRNFSLLK